MAVKVSTTDTSGLMPIQVPERAVIVPALLGLLHRKCMGIILIGCKCCAEHSNEAI